MTALSQLDTEGAAAPPRSNGELVFAQPWESRAFALAISLSEAGVFGWDEFRDELITQISAWERQPQGEWSYYACWLDALEQVIVARHVIGAADVLDRATALALRPAGHDHDHDH